MLWKLTQIQHTIGLWVLSSFWLDAAMQGLDYTWHFAGFFICCWKMANNACNNNTNLLCKNYICTIEYFCKFEKMLKFCQIFDWNTWSDFKTRIQFLFLNYDFSLSKKVILRQFLLSIAIFDFLSANGNGCEYSFNWSIKNKQFQHTTYLIHMYKFICFLTDSQHWS